MDSNLEKLVNQCNSNDVDAKIDAVTKLQAAFESETEISDPDAIIQALKACLKHSNQHLTTATVSALPSFLPLVLSRSLQQARPGQSHSPATSTSSTGSTTVDVVTLRHVLSTFLPSPGIIDRLGDSREKAREKARESLVILGGRAFRSSANVVPTKSGKNVETPLMIFERFLRENGLSSKVWRIREQSMLTVVHIRRVHHTFPLRPYLPLLVAALEDTDSNVRECSRQSIIELFTGPAINDAARSDLKKELAKKGVRKTIADSVLSRVLAGSGGGGSGLQSEAGSENGDLDASVSGKRAYMPPSAALLNRSKNGIPSSRAPSRTGQREMSRPPSRPSSRAAMISPPPIPSSSSTNEGTAEVKPVYVASARDLENEFDKMAKHFEGRETEHNWGPREQAMIRVRGMLKGDVHTRYPEVFLSCLKPFIDCSLKTLASLRTTVSSNTCSLYSELAIKLGPALDPFCDTLLLNLIRMSTLTKKIIAQQSQDTVATIFRHSSAPPRTVLPTLWHQVQEKNIQARLYAISHLKTFIESHGSRSKHAIESHGGLDTLEKCVRKGLADSNIGVRESARTCFWVFEGVWKERGRAIFTSLDSTSRKNLEKVAPNPDAVEGLPPPTPQVKKSSIAAAIAATRAKAKAVATAPPTLMHQATSTAHAVRATSPPTNGRASPVPMARSMSACASQRSTSPISGSSASLGSPPSKRARVVSSAPATGTLGRSTNVNPVPLPPSRHIRTPSGGSPRSLSPVSPPANSEHTFQRRISSPLAPNLRASERGMATLKKAMQTALPVSPDQSTDSLVQSTPPPEFRQAHNVRSSLSSHLRSPSGSRRQTLLLSKMMSGQDDDSLLMATNIPIPDDSDTDMDISMNGPSPFAPSYELHPPAPPSHTSSARSPASPRSPRSPRFNELSTGNNSSTPPSEMVVEDAMRARAEQAESAAERLLELNELEEDGGHVSPLHPSLLRNSHAATPKPKVKSTVASALKPGPAVPSTPVNRATAVLKQAAMFQDSPAHNAKPVSLMDVLQHRQQETEWWRKRRHLLEKGEVSFAIASDDKGEELEGYISAFEHGDADVKVLQSLALLCTEVAVADSNKLDNPFASDSISPRSSPNNDFWSTNKRFNRLFSALLSFLGPASGEELLEYGLIVIWEMLEHQFALLEGREAELFSCILNIRYCNKLSILEVTNNIRDALTTRVEPVYGLTTFHACLRSFQAAPPHPSADNDVKSSTYAFGLVAMGKCILRLPEEVLEDELPRIRVVLISALNDTSSLVVRESAAAVIISAQLVLRDETHLFALLDGLADEKKNLLTYLFDKHGARGMTVSSGPSGIERLQKELMRLDTRTSTPPRRLAAS